ncbi:hypothetical protein DHC50_06100 [Arenibacter sp. A80]|jgi:hypothetical protein|nr:hypothetical protein [Arenibacter sp. A80]RFT57190.1 hypothetical protein D0S24_06100 [Arenibacter sp. P308M17]
MVVRLKEINVAKLANSVVKWTINGILNIFMSQIQNFLPYEPINRNKALILNRYHSRITL